MGKVTFEDICGYALWGTFVGFVLTVLGCVAVAAVYHTWHLVAG